MSRYRQIRTAAASRTLAWPCDERGGIAVAGIALYRAKGSRRNLVAERLE